jgi:hypothetical protein
MVDLIHRHRLYVLSNYSMIQSVVNLVQIV